MKRHPPAHSHQPGSSSHICPHPCHWLPALSASYAGIGRLERWGRSAGSDISCETGTCSLTKAQAAGFPLSGVQQPKQLAVQHVCNTPGPASVTQNRILRLAKAVNCASHL